MKRPSVKDVARVAGVSVSTVSRVISAHPHVSPGARAAVEAAIGSLGFTPSQIARSMVRRSTSTIGLIVSDITNPYYPELIRGVDDVAYARGFSVFVGNSDDDLQREEKLVSVMRERAVDGILHASTRLDSTVLTEITTAGIPLVLTNRTARSEAFNVVTVDDVEGAKQAVQHLLRLGHTKIAHVAGPRWASNTLDRIQGYKDALREAGVAYNPRLITESAFSLAGGYRATEQILSTEAPSAIFCANDQLALGVLTALRHLRRSVPDEIAVVSFDDTPIARSVFVDLSSVSFDTYDMGRRAARRLLELIEEPRPREAVQNYLPPTLKIRGTCGGRP